MTFSFIEMPGLTSLKEAQAKVCKDCGCEQGNINPECSCPHDSKDTNGNWWVNKSTNEGKAYGPTGIAYSVPPGHPDEVDPKTGEKKLHKTNGKKKVTQGKTEDEPTRNNGETATANPKMSTKTEDMKISTRRKAFTKSGKAPKRKFKNVMPHLSGVNAPRGLELNSTQYEDTAHDPKHIKQAIGVASDPRYKGGNYTGAVNVINKIAPGLANHPQVAAVLKRQNEDVKDIPKKYRRALSSAKGAGSKTVTLPGMGDKTYTVTKKKDKFIKNEEWNWDELSSLNEAQINEFIDNLTEEEFIKLENLMEKDGLIKKAVKAVIKAPFKLAAKGIKRMTVGGRADAAQRRHNKLSNKLQNRARLKHFKTQYAKLKNNPPPAYNPKYKPLAAQTEYQGDKTMNEMSNIRKALLDVVEKKSHGHGHTNAREKWDDAYTGAGAKKMRDDGTGGKTFNVDDTEKLSHDDAEKAGRAGPKQSPSRNNGDNTKSGDRKIVKSGTPMKDPGAQKDKKDPNVDKKDPTTNEGKEMFNRSNINSIVDAYKSMNEATAKVDSFLGHKHAKRAGIGVKVHGSSMMGGDDVTLSHSDPAKLHKYCDNHCGGEEQGVVVKHNGKTWSPS